MRALDGCIVLPGNDLVGMNCRNNPYDFRQDGTFLYYAGQCLPGCVLWLDCDSGQEVLLGPQTDMNDFIWTGTVPGVDVLAGNAGLTRSAGTDELPRLIADALARGRRVHYLPAYRAAGTLLLMRLFGLSEEAILTGVSVELVQAVVRQRSVKSVAEVDEIREAISLSEAMYALLLRECRPGLSENVLYARLQELLLARGSHEAFPMILSCRGEILHNHCHDQTLAAGDLLLVDSGAVSPGGYASDLTRTLPVGGRFSALQRDLYDTVLAAQRAGIETMSPGVRFLDCHLAAARRLVENLSALGIMRGNADEAVAVGAHALFMPHGLGHMLGLDVHDMEALGEDYVGYDETVRRSAQFGLSGLRLGRRLEPGFVVTVEPGLYFIPHLIDIWQGEGRHASFIDYQAVQQFRNCGGIRIEDDVLVTPGGVEVLSRAIPKEADEICRAMETAA